MKKAKEQYTVQLEPEFVERLDKMAAKLELSRSQLMRNLLKTAYDDAVIYDKLGVFKAIQVGRMVKEYKDKLVKEFLSKKTD